MNRLVLLPIFILLFFGVKAQDKIISINHDTIHCTIISVSGDYIMYEQKNTDRSVSGKVMPLSQVSEYSRSGETEIISDMRIRKTQNPAYIPKNKFCLGLNSGLSKMPWYLDNIPSSYDMPDFYDKLKSGFHMNLSAHYMIKSFLGLGTEYSFFKASINGTTQREYPSSLYLTITEKYRLFANYLGVSVLFQQHLNISEKFTFSESLSGGVLFLHLEHQITYPYVSQSGYTTFSHNELLAGESFCGKFGLTAEYKLTEALAIGLGGNLIWSSLKKADYDSKGSDNNGYSQDNEKLSKPLQLSRFDYSFVLRYSF